MRNDQLHGKPLHKILIEFLMEAKISGATAWTGVDGGDLQSTLKE
jgi:PII-like signaling protein